MSNPADSNLVQDLLSLPPSARRGTSLKVLKVGVMLAQSTIH
jgi:hypothetical protein